MGFAAFISRRAARGFTVSEDTSRYYIDTGVDVSILQFLHSLGVFPTYRNSPINSNFDRILQVGDASGIQSPLSFGGFGSLTRHIERCVQCLHECVFKSLILIYLRITSSLDEALQYDLVTAEYLNLINSYQPNLSAG